MTDLIERLRRAGTGGVDLHTEAADEIERLRGWLEGDAYCPCCGTNDICVDDCTFADDCPDANDRMEQVRAILSHKSE